MGKFLMWIMCFLMMTSLVKPETPIFENTETAITAVAGETAVLPCRIKNLNYHKVTWNDGTRNVLSFMDRRVIDNDRISVERPLLTENLNIRNVTLRDEGRYVCQINTYPVKTRELQLVVVGTPIDLNVTATVGTTAVLPCRMDAKLNMIYWRKEETKSLLATAKSIFIEDTRFAVDEEANLLIKKATLSDKGLYTCVELKLGRAAEFYIVNLFLQEKTTRMDLNVTVEVGTTAVLPCPKKPGLQHFQVVWSKDGSNSPFEVGPYIYVADTRYSVDNDWNLLIKDATLSDKGRYKCGFNIPGKATKEYFVNLLLRERPRIVEASGDMGVKEGENVEFWCNVTGLPEPTVTWYKIYKEFDKKEELGVGNVLKLTNVTRRDDAFYDCSAENGISPDAKFTIDLTVYFIPEVYAVTRRLEQHLGGKVTLSCQVESSPHASVIWLKNNVAIGSFKHRQHTYVDAHNTRTSILEIRYLQDKDFGDYTCHAQNFLGEDEANISVIENTTTTVGTTTVAAADPQDDITTISLDAEKSQSQEPYVRITYYTGDVTVVKGDDVTLWCEAEGDPDSVITWYTISANEKNELKTGSSTLKLQDVEENQELECIATGSDGRKDNRHMRLIVEYAPKVSIVKKYMAEGGMITSTLDCIIEGNPLQFYAWKENGMLIDRDDDGYQITECKTGDSSIKYSVATSILNEENESEFTCEAINMHGQASATITAPGRN